MQTAPEPARRLLDHAASLGDDPATEELRRLGGELRQVAATLDIAGARAAVGPDSPRAVLAGDGDGPMLALRRYEPGHVSSVHSHAWTVLMVLSGEGTLERWVAGTDQSARLVSTERTGAAPTVIGAGECHRQHSRGGALELVLVANYRNVEGWQTDYEPTDGSLTAAGRIDDFVTAWAAADVEALTPLYAVDAFLDLHVPRWRVQVEGRDKILAFAAAEEFQPDYRLDGWSASPTPDGWVWEFEAHYTHNGSPALSQVCMRVRTGPTGLVTEQSMYCTGIWDQATIEGLRHSGGLPRP